MILTTLSTSYKWNHIVLVFLLDIWIASMLRLLWIMLLWSWVYKYLIETLLSILLDICTEVELLDHMVIPFLIIWRTTILFSTAAVLSYFPTNRVQGLQFLHILATICFVLFLAVAILIGVRWFLVVLICISPLISDVHNLFMCLLAICTSSMKKCVFKSFANFLNQAVGFLLLNFRILCICVFWKLILYQI